MNIETINNALQVISEQREIIITELVKEFPIGCLVSYMNNNSESNGIVMNHSISDSNIIRLEVKTVDFKKIKLVSLKDITGKTITDKVNEKQSIINDWMEQYGIKDATLFDEKRAEVLKAVLIKVGLSKITNIEVAKNTNISDVVDFLLDSSSRLYKEINKMKFDRFHKVVDALILDNMKFKLKHKTHDKYQYAILSDIYDYTRSRVMNLIMGKCNSNITIKDDCFVYVDDVLANQ